MAKYRKKPVEIEAVKFEDTTESISAIAELSRDRLIRVDYRQKPVVMYIPTLEGVMVAQVGDYIIRGIAGELYPCKPDIFEKTYERVNESNGGI
ncbi:hypothetical protein M3616_13165 [Bacillus velezensis]|uniref:hypothetical protein n=1 Tax=Bacillus amyloliquefaciens group TaxID=1938374 RepID=UPI00090BD663|nr:MULTISPECIES: hypothetical protein [Bacillus amyloliquefaciens group]APH50416.1 hypothetical protein BSF20_19155 [Bacillus amyloliquefaciens]MCM3276277.1 hypothetical protein [Bacillus velezensis]MCM3350173.1 hypothetical protein [Bacillus velezensis]PQB10006.1 hypothetical protein C5O26_18525 [Bacillus velezensis]PQB11795.1 hypothetical protein C5O26_09200 [Bacillus velezensis]